MNSDHLKWEIVFYDLTLVQVSLILLRALKLKKLSFLLKVLTVFLKKRNVKFITLWHNNTGKHFKNSRLWLITSKRQIRIFTPCWHQSEKECRACWWILNVANIFWHPNQVTMVILNKVMWNFDTKWPPNFQKCMQFFKEFPR